MLVLDMFWGDLSGLDGAIKRMVTELFTLIFHLCQLGRDAALHAVLALRQSSPSTLGDAGRPMANVLAYSHQWADWMFTKPNLLLNGLLVLLCLWWLPLQALGQRSSTQTGQSGQELGWLLLSGGALALICVVSWAIALYRGLRGAGLGVALICSAALVIFWLGPFGSLSASSWSMQWAALMWGATLALVFCGFVRFGRLSCPALNRALRPLSTRLGRRGS